MLDIVLTRSIDIAAAPQRVFDAALSFDIPAIVRKRGAVPGVASVNGPSRWTAPGETRALTLTDGSSIEETLVELKPQSFTYRVAGFSGPFGLLVASAEGRFAVEPAGDGAQLFWRYKFLPKSPAAAVALRFVAGALWPGYMQAVLNRIKQSIETP